MALLSAFLTYAVKFILLLCVAAGGFLFGRRMKQSKKAKN